MTASPANPAAATAAAQRLRFRRALWGSSTYLFTSLFVLGFYAMGIVARTPVVVYLTAVGAINLLFLSAIASGLNLRFREPSLTGPQVVISLWPSIYIMFHLEDPQARTAFLLFAMIGMLLATLVFDFRRLVALGGIILFAYLVLLGALKYWAPQRVNLGVEVIIIFAYAVVLLFIGFIGSQVAALRAKLRIRNRELEAAVAELKELARLDPLTRLPNRRSLMDHLIHEQSRVERRHPDNRHMCLCLLDVDHFKRVNDTYGHQAGDEVLQYVSKALQTVLRKSDFVGRYGGEEFLLVLPETTREGGLMTAERVRAAIAEAVLPCLPEGEHVTVSIGLALHVPGDSVETTLGRADAALYEAKGQGRDRVVMDPYPEAEPTPPSAAG